MFIYRKDTDACLLFCTYLTVCLFVVCEYIGAKTCSKAPRCYVEANQKGWRAEIQLFQCGNMSPKVLSKRSDTHLSCLLVQSVLQVLNV